MGPEPRRKRKPARRSRTRPVQPAELQPPSTEAEGAGIYAESSHELAEAGRLDENTDGNSDEQGVASQLILSDHDIALSGSADASESSSSPENERPLPLDEARLVLERLFIAMLAAGLSPLQALASSRPLLLADLQERLESQGSGEAIVLSLVQERALCAVANVKNESEAIDTTHLHDLASAATFRVEMLEFQIRQAVLDRAGSKSRGKVDVQRVLARIASSLPADIAAITAKEFARLLEEKLGMSLPAASSRLLTNVVFARIIGTPFAQTLPKRLSCARVDFFAALESFVVDKPLSLDSVEGQLRHLVVSHADLRARFQAFDTDGSGSISADEFVAFLEREAQMHYPRDVLLEFIRRFDLDGDGTLNYDEFVAFVSPKQFGIHVLTPFGMFYQAADRRESMVDVVAKIKTRLFWMQYNDLFATATHPVYNKPPVKLKVTDQFILTRHFGTLGLQYQPSDPIAKVLTNGEMVVLMLLAPGSSTRTAGNRLPPFEYRLKPTVNKRSIPPLLCWSLRETSRNRSTPTPSKSLIPGRVTRHSVIRTANVPARAGNSIATDEAAPVASSNTSSATRPRRSTITPCTARSKPRPPWSPQLHVAVHHVQNTESQKRSQTGPSRTQPRSDLASAVQDVIVSPPTGIYGDLTRENNPSSDDNNDGREDEQDADDPENPSEPSDGREVSLGLDSSAGGDETACPDELCVVVDAALLCCDEESPPPSYSYYSSKH
jgi:hypothetical protein